MVKESACNVGDPVLILGSGRSPGGGNGNPPQYSCLENSLDRGTWWATVHEVSQSLTQLNGWHTQTHHFSHQISLTAGKKDPHIFLKETSLNSSKGKPRITAKVTISFLTSSFSFSSVAQSCPTLWPHEPQHARPPCPSPTPRVHPNPCPWSWWCHPTISSSVVPFCSCPQSFLTSGSFQMSQLLASGGQSIGVSVSASVLPMNTQDQSPLGWTGWISLQFKGLKSLLQHHSSKASILQHFSFLL